MSDSRVIKTYVWHGDDCYFVSTIDRNSSSAIAPDMRYAETMVWRFDWTNNERISGILHSESDSEGCIRTHLSVVERLHRTGNPEMDELL